MNLALHRVGAHCLHCSPMAPTPPPWRRLLAARCAMRATRRMVGNGPMRRRLVAPVGFCPWALGLLPSAPLVLPMIGDLFGQH